ncbi:MAG: hypothetical protein KC591_12405 [Gemmatimonadetes bacterium]|nr:hypothetical protein [Gemmatimonadota bacterium]
MSLSRALARGYPFLLAPILFAPPTASARSADRPEPAGRVHEYAGWYHSVGNLLLHVSNWGMFGRNGQDLTNPSGEWPAGADEEYLYAAALWVGGVVHRDGEVDTLVTTGRFGQFGELVNTTPDEGCGSPAVGICETFEGAPNGTRRFDDDGDGLVDEDPLDGADNDGDGRIDEDFAGISQQMFRSVMYDTSTFENRFNPDQSDHHHPLGLQVTQESYQWTDPGFDDFVGVEFRIRNISDLLDGTGWDIEHAYVGFMVDSDVGIDDPDLDVSVDDHVAFTTVDTTLTPPVGPPVDIDLTMGYMYDELGLQNDDVSGYLGALFLGHTVDTTTAGGEEPLAPREVGIHAFTTFARGFNDPRNDLERYRLLRGLSDTSPTIEPNSVRSADYRFLVSAGPFARIPPGSTLTFQVAFVCGEMIERVDELGNVVRFPDMTNPIQAQRAYDGEDDNGEIVHWSTSSPPPPPNQRVTPGDRSVTLEWDNFSENTADPLTGELDFAGYQVWKAEGWIRESNVPSENMWRLVADFDSTELGRIDTGGLGVGQYRFVDTRVQNGFWYWYAVTAYDRGTFRPVVDFEADPPETTWIREAPPKYGKFSQTMRRVMPRTTPAQTLDDVYVVPNPYKESAAWDLLETPGEPTGRRVRFFNLPARATIRIFTLSGDHVATIEHDAGSGAAAGQTYWNLISKNGQDTVSGVYVWHVRADDGQEQTGRLVVIR